ncbi:MAG: ABC transporter substrate-binding protein [Alphaproteobacteria bacterium]|nr:ABC transporter substrate-binding protein [Alphaproteobacteria bacterium]
MMRLGWAYAGTALLAGLAAIVLAAGPGGAELPEVKVAAIVPVSGPWARQGQLNREGAEMAVDEINQAGGIKALGGARLKLLVADAGDTTEKAKNAAERLLSQEPDLVGGTGAWLSSFTLAITEVTERAHLPWFTMSYSDAITNRGFHYVFQTSPTADRMAREAIPTFLKLVETSTGKRPQTIGIIADNTAANVSFTKPMHEGLLEQLGLKLVVDEVFTPPLSDATPLIQKLRSARPDFLLLGASAMPDDKLILEKLDEFHLSKGRLPMLGGGTPLGAPELKKVIDPDLLDGLLVVVGDWGMKGDDKLIERFRARTGEPWMTQDSLSTYGDMWLFKEALERAAAADRVKVAEQIRQLDITVGPATLAFPGAIKFDENGRRADAPIVIIQWQKGEAVSVFPTDRAMASPVWAEK